jgi:WD40 repeat protein
LASARCRVQAGNLRAALLKSPAAIGVLRGDGEGMSAAALSPDERTLAAGDPSGNVFLFDTTTRRRVATIKPGNANSWIVQLAYSPDGSRLAVAHDTQPRGNVVTVFDSDSHRAVARMMPPPHRFVSALRYSADGTELDAIAVTQEPESRPGFLTRFDARSGRRLFGPKLIGRSEWSPLLGSSQATQVVTAGEDEVTVHDARTLRAAKRFAVAGTAYALSPDDRTLAIGDDGGAVRILDIRNGAVRVASGRHAGAVSAAAFTSDGRTLVTGGEEGDVIVWNVEQGTAGERLSGHTSGISSLHITRNGKTLYSGIPCSRAPPSRWSTPARCAASASFPGVISSSWVATVMTGSWRWSTRTPGG